MTFKFNTKTSWENRTNYESLYDPRYYWDKTSKNLLRKEKEANYYIYVTYKLPFR